MTLSLIRLNRIGRVVDFFSEMASRLKTGRPWFVCPNPSNFIQRPQRRQKNALNRKVLEYNKNTRYGGERGGVKKIATGRFFCRLPQLCAICHELWIKTLL